MQLIEKYITLNKDFPSMAGAIAQTLEAQKRAINKLSGAKQPEDVQALILASAKVYDDTHQILVWMRNMLQGIANDSEALKEGSNVRTQLRDQNEIVKAWINRNDAYMEQIEEAIMKHNSYKHSF